MSVIFLQLTLAKHFFLSFPPKGEPPQHGMATEFALIRNSIYPHRAPQTRSHIVVSFPTCLPFLPLKCSPIFAGFRSPLVYLPSMRSEKRTISHCESMLYDEIERWKRNGTNRRKKNTRNPLNDDWFQRIALAPIHMYNRFSKPSRIEKWWNSTHNNTTTTTARCCSAVPAFYYLRNWANLRTRKLTLPVNVTASKESCVYVLFSSWIYVRTRFRTHSQHKTGPTCPRTAHHQSEHRNGVFFCYPFAVVMVSPFSFSFYIILLLRWKVLPRSLYCDVNLRRKTLAFAKTEPSTEGYGGDRTPDAMCRNKQTPCIRHDPEVRERPLTFRWRGTKKKGYTHLCRILFAHKYIQPA